MARTPAPRRSVAAALASLSLLAVLATAAGVGINGILGILRLGVATARALRRLLLVLACLRGAKKSSRA
mgnify:CR=1 FL=1